MTYNELATLLKPDISLDEEQIKRLEKFQNLVIEKNKLFNLTSITENDSFLIKHLFDSLYPFRKLSLNGLKVLDFGSGGGFPGIPLAILFKDAQFTLLDATEKKCAFLKYVSEELELDNVEVIHARGEELSSLNEHFDFISARAVSSLPILLEMIAPLLKINGEFLSLKGANGIEELNVSHKAMRILSLSLINIEEYDLPLNLGKRTTFLFKKEKATNKKYPRAYAAIIQKPL